jgi:hypothetical protein
MALTMGFALGLTRKRPMVGQIPAGAHRDPESERIREQAA